MPFPPAHAQLGLAAMKVRTGKSGVLGGDLACVASRAQVKDCTVYEGIVHQALFEGKEFSVVLHWAKPVQGSAAATPGAPVKQLTIASADVLQITARDVDLTPEGLGGTSVNGVHSFETDSEISKGKGG